MKWKHTGAFIVTLLVISGLALGIAPLRSTTIQMTGASDMGKCAAGKQALNCIDDVSEVPTWHYQDGGTSSMIGGGGGGGSVSLTCGAGLACSPSPITGTGSVSVTTPQLFSEANWGLQGYGTAGLDFGNYTMGTIIETHVPGIVITGVKFYWPIATSLTLDCELRDSGGSIVKSGSVTVSASAAIKSCSFSSSATLTPFAQYTIDTWETTGTHGYAITISSFTGALYPAANADNIELNIGVLRYKAVYAAGHANPTTDGSGYSMMTEPVFQ